MTHHISFLGLGTMGEPMAENLVRAGHFVTVWNRSETKSRRLGEAGATVATSVDKAFAAAPIVMLMLANGEAIDVVLDRNGPAFVARVKDRTIVHLGTTTPEYSASLSRDVLAAGGAYVEAPVSGSRGPAQAGTLVAMLGGTDETVSRVEPLLTPIASAVVRCGPVPRATLTKLAINSYLIGKVTALAEAVGFAERAGIDMAVFANVLRSGPMASEVMRAKLPKLIGRDFSVQAAVGNVLESARLITGTAQQIGAALPLLEVAESLYAKAKAAGHGSEDMASVIAVLTDINGA